MVNMFLLTYPQICKLHVGHYLGFYTLLEFFLNVAINQVAKFLCF